MPRPVVIKVGGSLYDLPDLAERLHSFCSAHADAILVPGGGSLIESIRQYDRCHNLGEEACHWLALKGLSVNALFLASLLPHATIVGDVGDRPPGLSILDGYAFSRADESRPGHLPHCWSATSDSLAVRVAVLVGAQELILLKSVDLPAEISWHEAARQGFVDEFFWRILPKDLELRFVNLRGSAPHSRRG